MNSVYNTENDCNALWNVCYSIRQTCELSWKSIIIPSLALVSPGDWWCHPIFLSKNLRPFLLIVTTPILSAFQVIVSPIHFVKFRRKKIFDFHQGGVTRGGVTVSHAPPHSSLLPPPIYMYVTHEAYATTVRLRLYKRWELVWAVSDEMQIALISLQYVWQGVYQQSARLTQRKSL